MENKIEIRPEVNDIMKKSDSLPEAFRVYKVRDNASNSIAAKDLAQLKAEIKMLKDNRMSITRLQDEAKKMTIALFAPSIEIREKVIEIIENAKLTWRREEEEKRIAEEKRLQQLARKEEEKLKKALEKRIENAKAKGNEEKVEELEQKKEEVYMPTPIVVSQVEKVKGEYVSKNWKYRIIDVDKIQREYMTPDTVKIGATVRAQKETCEIKGIEVYYEESIGNRK